MIHAVGLRRRSRGFTLLELSVALVILAVLLAVGVPQIQRFNSNSKLRSRVDTLVSDLQMCRTGATSNAARTPPTFVVFALFRAPNVTPTGPEPSNYSVFTVANDGSPGVELRSDAVEQEITVTMTGAPQSNGKFDSSACAGLEMAVNGVSPHQVIVFQSNGTLESTTPIRIRLNNQVQQFRIDVSHLGSVQVTPETPGTST